MNPFSNKYNRFTDTYSLTNFAQINVKLSSPEQPTTLSNKDQRATFLSRITRLSQLP